MSAKSAADLGAVAAALRGARRIVLTTHVRPDGDALGSMLALHLSAGLADKQSSMVLADEVPRRYAFLFADRRPAGAAALSDLIASADLAIVLDTCSFEQLGPMAEELTRYRRKVAVIDHHATADPVGTIVWREESAAAAGVMVAELLEELRWPLDLACAEAIATAVCADTGWLRYANADARAMRVVARMAEAGVRLDELYARLYQSDRPQRVRLLAAALASLELHAADRLAVMTLTAEDFARTGAGPDETEELAGEPLRIAGVEIAVLVIEQAGGGTRASLRSRGAADVAELAGRFGGGGHARASGFRSKDAPGVLKGVLLAACGEVLRCADPGR